MLWGTRVRNETADEQTSSAPEESGDGAETLAASVVLLKRSVLDLHALTDEDALDLRARMRALEDRLSLVETGLAELADRPVIGSSQAPTQAEAAAAPAGDSAPGPRAGRGRKRPKRQERRNRRAGGAQTAGASDGAEATDESHSNQ